MSELTDRPGTAKVFYAEAPTHCAIIKHNVIAIDVLDGVFIFELGDGAVDLFPARNVAKIEFRPTR